MHQEKAIIHKSLRIALGFVTLLWGIKIIEIIFTINLSYLGILPRTTHGVIGILTSPFIHNDFIHLLSNTFPLLILITILFYFYHKSAFEIFLWIYISTGFWVWIIARPAYHIGASGIVYGLVAFLFFSGLLRRDKKSLTITLVIIFLYSGMIYGIFPDNPSISWESHLLGSIAGIVCAFFFRNVKITGNEEVSLSLEESPNQIKESNLHYVYKETKKTHTSSGQAGYTIKIRKDLNQ